MTNVKPRSVLDNVADPARDSVALDTLETSATLSERTPLQKRAQAKFASRAIGTVLTEYARSVGSPMEKAYRSVIYCGETIDQENGVLESRYCGCRACLVCARIRTAKAINLYGPEIEAWPDRWMVTLTAPNVPGEKLRGEIEREIHVFRLCWLSLKRRGIPTRGIRKLEATYNREDNTYHPHFHFLCDNETAARELVKAWLKRNPEAKPWAQDVKKANRGSVIELLKYSFKMVTKTRKGKKNEKKEFVPPPALDTILRALKGKRVYQTIGFELEGAEEIEADKLEVAGMAATKREAETITWSWEPEATDWVDRETGETLTGYVPGARFVEFVEKIANCNNSSDTQLTLIESSLPAG